MSEYSSLLARNRLHCQPMDANDVAALLERIVAGAVGVTTRALSEATPGYEPTFPQWRALLILGEAPDGARVGRLAAHVGVTLPATGRLLRRLEQRGLVGLTPDAADRRATRARLAPAGREVRDSILRYQRGILLERAGTLLGQDARPLRNGLEAAAQILEPYA